jgi:hypothetical protein
MLIGGFLEVPESLRKLLLEQARVICAISIQRQVKLPFVIDLFDPLTCSVRIP